MSFKKHDFRYDFEVCCPYNKKHQMPFSKLWFHISKGCKDKRDKGHKYKVCPYNSLHIIILPKWESHVQKCLSHINQNKDSDVDDIFQEMQKVAAIQFGNNQQQQQQQKQQQQQQQIHQQNDFNSQSAISSITYKHDNQIPNWGEIYDSQSEVTEKDIEEINQISEMNFFEEENERQQKHSSSISKSFLSSGAKSKKQQDDDDDYYD